jgi:hypothetical protein
MNCYSSLIALIRSKEVSLISVTCRGLRFLVTPFNLGYGKPIAFFFITSDRKVRNFMKVMKP